MIASIVAALTSIAAIAEAHPGLAKATSPIRSATSRPAAPWLQASLPPVPMRSRLLLGDMASTFSLAPCAAGGGSGGGPPPGSVAIWLTALAPTGYLLCDGAAVSRTTYATLFAVISTAFGAGDGSTTFGLPNLKGRVPVGLDAAQAEFDVMGETGGAKTVTLDATMMPAHTHVQDAHTHVQNSHNHVQDSHNHTQNSFAPRILNSGTAGTVGVQGASAASNANASNSATTATNQVATATNQVATAVNQAATATNQSAGGGLAHANLPPYLVVNYVIKT